jgi:hypothetical protein
VWFTRHFRSKCCARPVRDPVHHTKGNEEKRGSKDSSDRSSLQWKVFDLQAYTQAETWDVPWGWKTIVFGMLAWAISFLLIGFVSVPIAAEVLHISDLRSMTPLQTSELQLIDQVRSACLCAETQSRSPG